jgi:hypothetical protein
MNSIKLISNAKTTALITFIGGTIIVLLFYLSNGAELGMLGLLYTAIMVIINLVVLSRLLLLSYRHNIKRYLVLKTTGLMLLNIPIFILYCWIGITLLNTVRITFVNSTQAEIDDLKITGCEEKYIPKLSSGQSKTVWISIPHDCGVEISYKLNGQTKEEEITGYVTNEGGYIMTFKIGTNQKPYDQDL